MTSTAEVPRAARARMRVMNGVIGSLCLATSACGQHNTLVGNYYECMCDAKGVVGSLSLATSACGRAHRLLYCVDAQIECQKSPFCSRHQPLQPTAQAAGNLRVSMPVKEKTGKVTGMFGHLIV